ncbi:MAG: hypothetical protein J5722_09190 [Oscillospiraceae bacterium]|nr:hypothetical protein [Oscillospiraceae bacterium]
MKRFPKRAAALAVAVVTAFTCAAALRGQPENDSGDGGFSAAAAEPFFPIQSDFTVMRAAQYADLPAGSEIGNVLRERFGAEVTDSSGLYRNYQIIYTAPSEHAYSYSENAALLYDPALRPELEAASEQQLADWLEPFLQFINTEREITGISQGYLVTVLDAVEPGGQPDTMRGEPVIDSNWSYSLYNVSCLGEYESDELTDCITAFDVPYMPWGTLHESSHAYVDTAKSPFVTSDEVFANIRLLCAVRSLNRIGLTFPDVLRRSERGRLHSAEASYISSSAFQYACRDMQNERNNRFLALAKAEDCTDLFFVRLGILFELGTDLSPWNPAIVSNRAFADELETHRRFDSCWTRLYALCISDPDQVNIGRIRFMIKPKSMYQVYLTKQYYNYDYAAKHPKTIRVKNPDVNNPAEQRVTLNVAYAIERRYGYRQNSGQRVWMCTPGTLRALNTLDFLFSESKPDAFEGRLDGAAAGHRRITYFSAANGIAA